MQPSHCAPEQALAIARQVGARRMLAVHWGTFDLSDEPSGEPPVRLRAEAARVGMHDDAVWVFGLGRDARVVSESAARSGPCPICTRRW